jgi:hypothetical protein
VQGTKQSAIRDAVTIQQSPVRQFYLYLFRTTVQSAGVIFLYDAGQADFLRDAVAISDPSNYDVCHNLLSVKLRICKVAEVNQFMGHCSVLLVPLGLGKMVDSLGIFGASLARQLFFLTICG